MTEQTRPPGAAAPLPGVTVVATVRDEEPYLSAAVRSILHQDYAGELHMVLAVGPSKDRTREIAEHLSIGDSRLTVIDNPSGSRSEGLNAAIAATTDEVVVRIDGHTVFESSYVRRAVTSMLEAGADAAGGIMSPSGQGAVQEAVARAMSHPAGLGSATFHTGGEAGPAQTVYLGAFRREAITAVGGFDPTIIRGEDWELCLRMRQAGSLLWFDPTLRVTYRPRRELRAVAKQFWRTGMWRREIMRRYPDTASARYLAPPAVTAAVAAGAGTLVLGAAMRSRPLTAAGAVVLGGYVAGECAAAAHAATRTPRLSRGATVAMPAVLVTMHLAWGAGFLRGVSTRARHDHRA